MHELVEAFRAESTVLEALLRGLTDAQWSAVTPATPWDVRDSVAHLALGNELAEECARTGRSTMIEDVMAAGSFAAFEQQQLARGRALPPGEVLAWWLASNAALAATLLGVEPAHRIPWGPNVMSASSFVTARIMETWAHGLDCFDAAEVVPVDTERLRHIAHLSWRSLAFAFALKGEPSPGPVRLVLTAPDGSTWELGDAAAPTVVRGTAGDWCRVAVHRDRREERSRLSAEGPDAAAVLRNVQAFLSA